jgi:hypothetical protein
MKKKLLVFIFLFAAQFVFAQDTDDKSDAALASAQTVFAGSVGQFQANFSALNSQLKTWGATKTFSPLTTIGGVAALSYCDNNSGRVFDCGFSFEKFLPQKISIGDSLNYKLSGWQLMTSIYGKDIIPAHRIALVGAPGIDWGTVKIQGDYKDGKTIYKNPFVSPFLRAEFRVIFWQIAVGVRGSYRYDISRKLWKQNNGNLSPLPNSKISGLGLQFFIGWGYAD